MTEEEIIRGCVKKDPACQHTLFKLYSGRLMTVCLRYSSDTGQANDMLQETFIRIFAAVSQYRFEGSFEGWLKRTAVNCCLRILQKKTIRFEAINEAVLDVTDDFVLPGTGAPLLLKLISELPEGYRIIFNLFVIEGYTHDEIAQLLHIKAATSRSQLAKARKMLQQQITERKKMDILL